MQRPYRLHLRRLQLGLVLDLGCGIGRNLINLGGAHAVIGVDHNPHSVEIAQSRGVIALTPDQFHDSSYALPSTFDSLLLSHVAEHMHRGNVVSLIKEYLIFLRPGGRVVAITPQEAGFRSDPTHIEFIDFRGMADILACAGLSILSQYSFPLPRVFGRVFKHNEFVSIGRKPD